MKRITLRDLLVSSPNSVPVPQVEKNSARKVITTDPHEIAEVLVRACYNYEKPK